MTDTAVPYTDIFGQQPFHTTDTPTSGQEVARDGETYYKISAVDRMRPFFMSIVSHSDHWMFLSSNGGLSAGRVNSDHALFPITPTTKSRRAQRRRAARPSCWPRPRTA